MKVLLLAILITLLPRMMNREREKVTDLLRMMLVYIIEIHGQCSGGIWPIENTTIGSFTISWRYNVTLNKVQFMIQGRIDSIDFMLEIPKML